MSVIYGNPIIAGGGGLELVANVADGATVTATLGSKTVTGISSGGQARLKIPQEGKWTVSAAIGTTVSAQQEVIVPATVDFALPAPVLNDTSWAIIKQVSDAGEGQNYWAVGDCKEVTMNGKVSNGLTLENYSAWVFIIGFNHNAEREGNGIAFQGFKFTKNGTANCLVDSSYLSTTRYGAFFCMNNADTSAGGWESSQMRKNVMPLIKAAFPAELQSVIKPSTIFTTQGSNDNACTATEDEIFLLAEFEIFGVRQKASLQEPNYLKQYTYYSAGNSKVKYRHDSAYAAVYWWERSPSRSVGNEFCSVDVSGNAYANTANLSYGCSPAFKV